MSMPVEFCHRQFSILETADHLRISRSMVYKLIADDALRPTKIGRRSVVSGAELERALKEMQKRQAR